jgi:hypothetical protein
VSSDKNQSESSNETFRLELRCPACGGALLAEVGPSRPKFPRHAWQCPYCRADHRTDFGGKVFWIVKRMDSATSQ